MLTVNPINNVNYTLNNKRSNSVSFGTGQRTNFGAVAPYDPVGTSIVGTMFSGVKDVFEGRVKERTISIEAKMNEMKLNYVI